MTMEMVRRMRGRYNDPENEAIRRYTAEKVIQRELVRLARDNPTAEELAEIHKSTDVFLRNWSRVRFAEYGPKVSALHDHYHQEQHARVPESSVKTSDEEQVRVDLAQATDESRRQEHGDH